MKKLIRKSSKKENKICHMFRNKKKKKKKSKKLKFYHINKKAIFKNKIIFTIKNKQVTTRITI